MQLILWAIPIFWITMFIEWRLSQDHDVKGYELRDSATSLSMGIGNLLVLFFSKFVALAAFYAVYQFRFFDIPVDAWWPWLLLIPAEDLCYYCFHRCGHVVRLFWAAHVNHHSSTHYNLSTALRQSWTGPFLTWIFWLPLPLLGFHPLLVIVAQSISALYQYWLHTEIIDRMGVFGWVFNTPSHHRVHHGSNPQYLDRNYGGILIIWDRLFGTFEAEGVRPDYGITRNIESHNPMVVAFHEWHAMLKDLRNARTWRGRFGYVFAPPGWREDGTGRTSKDLRREAKEALEADAAVGDSRAS